MTLTNEIKYKDYIYKENKSYDILKRIMDIFLSIILLILFFPLIIITIIVFVIFYKSNIFYLQERVGYKGKIFKLYKFRTMKLNAEEDGNIKWAEKNDPRCTFLGNILRKTSIDEIPQLLNVLNGDLSIVGPRPERPFFINSHSGLKGFRLLVKPGLTGLAQVNGRYYLDIDEKLKYDFEYIHNRNLWLDIKIILKTIPVVLSCKGAW